MRARRLIVDAVYGPAELKLIGKAFDDAWEQIRPQISNRAEATDAARLKLAEVVLALTKAGNRKPEELAEAAVRAMLARPIRL